MSDSLAAALIGAGAAIIVLLVGLLAQRRFEHTRWLRERRLEVYADLGQVLRDLSDLGNRVEGAFREAAPKKPQGAEWRALVQVLRTKVAAGEPLQQKMELIGSPRMRELAALLFDAKDMLWSIDEAIDRISVGDREWLPGEEVDEFFNTARRELGAEGRVTQARTAVVMWWRRTKYRVRNRLKRKPTPTDDAAA